MLIFHFALTETLRNTEVLYRSVKGESLEEALAQIWEKFPWANLLGWLGCDQ